MLTGCRKSEILNLHWDDVDHTAGELRLRDAKTGPRMVPPDDARPASAGRYREFTGKPLGVPRTKRGESSPESHYLLGAHQGQSRA